MRRFLLLPALALALGLSACTRPAETEVKAPPRAMEESRSQVSEKKPARRQDAPGPVAPPPAYGNRVVLAKGPPVLADL